MGKWNRWLKGALSWTALAVDVAETTDMSGPQKAQRALAYVSEAIGLNDLENTDPDAASAVARGIRMINDGTVLIQNSVGNYAGISKAKKEVAAAKRASARTAAKKKREAAAASG